MATATETIQHPHVLVVADDAVLRELMTRVLSTHGYRVVGASSGRDALRACQGGAFDVLVADYGMPDLGAVDVADISRRDPAKSEILAKPFGAAELVRRVDRALSGSGRLLLAA